MILVTGGAGYIGSQIVCELLDEQESVVVLDDLSVGKRELVPDVEFVLGNVGDPVLLEQVFSRFDISEVIHLAASTVVPESVVHPEKFYCNNTANTAVLLQKCVEHKVKRFIFSSTAAVYGLPEQSEQVDEQTPCQPINPYGRSKLLAEQILQDVAAASGMQQITLRYFNVAGADPKGRVGPVSPPSLLIRVAVRAALGLQDKLCVFGDDFATKDGTGVRDYLHVADLASAHLAALKYLREGGESVTLNCGYGRGYSVHDVISAVEKLTDKSLNVEICPRRAGDPDSLTANPTKLKALLDWTPQYDNLATMISDAYEWEKQLTD